MGIKYKKTLAVKCDWRSFNANHIMEEVIMANKIQYRLRYEFGEKMLEECKREREVPVGQFWSKSTRHNNAPVPYETVEAWIKSQKPKHWQTRSNLIDFFGTGELQWASHIQHRLVYGYTTEPDGTINEMVNEDGQWTQFNLYYLAFNPDEWLAYQICK